MRTAIVLTLLVLALIVGGLIGLRRSAKTGMPSQEVIERATRRARELEERERMEKED